MATGIKVGALKSLNDKQMNELTHDLVHRPNGVTKTEVTVSRPEKMKKLSFIRSIQNVSVLEKIVDSHVFPRDFNIALGNYYDYDRLVEYVSFYLKGNDNDAILILSDSELSKIFFAERLHENASHDLAAGEAYEMMVLHQRLVEKGGLIDPHAYVEFGDAKVVSFSKLFPTEVIEKMIRYLANDCEVVLEDTFFLDRLNDRNNKSWLDDKKRYVTGDLIRYRAVDYALSQIGLHWYKIKDTLAEEKAAAEKEQQEREANMKAKLDAEALLETVRTEKLFEQIPKAILIDLSLGAQGKLQHAVRDWERLHNLKVVNYIMGGLNTGVQYVQSVVVETPLGKQATHLFPKPTELENDTENYLPQELVNRTHNEDLLYLQKVYIDEPRPFESEEVYQAWKKDVLEARNDLKLLEEVKALPEIEVVEDHDAELERLAAVDILYKKTRRAILALKKKFSNEIDRTSPIFWNNELERVEETFFTDETLHADSLETIAYAEKITDLLNRLERAERFDRNLNKESRDAVYVDLVETVLVPGTFKEEVARCNENVTRLAPVECRNARKKAFKTLAKKMGLKKRDFKHLLELEKIKVSAKFDNRPEESK